MAGLTAQQLEDFDRDGYLVVEDVLSEDDLSAIRAEYEEIMDRESAKLVADGTLRPLQGTTFSERYIEALGQLDDMYALYQHLDISLPMIDELDSTATMNAGRAVFNLLTHPGLLDIAESVIGPEIYSNPVQHTRIKPPRKHLPHGATDANIAATLWHQDAAVIEPSGDDTNMLTVWLAITDATAENGCLIAVPGSHKPAETTLHCPGKVFDSEIYIPEDIIDGGKVVPLEVKAGGMVLLHKFTEHGSGENNTEELRWSFDLRYQPIGEPTGREVFPGFVARSAADPDSVVTDHREWGQLWWDALDAIVTGRANYEFGGRWAHNAIQPVCA